MRGLASMYLGEQRTRPAVLVFLCSNRYKRSLRYIAERSPTQGMERGLSYLRGTP